jgi:hypothetical protein
MTRDLRGFLTTSLCLPALALALVVGWAAPSRADDMGAESDGPVPGEEEGSVA